MTDTLKPQIYDYNSFAEAVRLFNILGGNFPDRTEEEFVEALKNQAYRVVEEAEEIIAACEALEQLHGTDRWEEAKELAIEVLDGVVDTTFVAIGLFQIASDYLPVQAATVRVCHNNLTKFTVDRQEADKSVEYYKANDVECEVEEIKWEGTPYYVVRRLEDRKVMKPVGYKNVDLSDLLEDVDD